jgi:hypothetical protein
MEGKAEKGGLATQFEGASEWNHSSRGSIFYFGAHVRCGSLYRDSCSCLSLCSIYPRFQGGDCPVYLTALSFQLLEDSMNVNLGHVASPCLPSGEDHKWIWLEAGKLYAMGRHSVSGSRVPCV